MSLQKEELLNHAITLYHQAPEVPMKRVPFVEKWRNERKLKKMTEKLQIEWKNKENDPEELVTAFLLELDDQRILFERPFLRFFLEQGYLEAAKRFLNLAKQQDGQLKTWEVYQAMRNVWIMNSLQLHWSLPLEVTPSVYAYSLLYPYTDNYLDDPSVSAEEKLLFNEQLGRIIGGESGHSNRIFELIQDIEQQFPRKQFPDVFESIRFIHEAQTSSLEQHRSLPSDEVLRLTFEKGGASVLADAFLVKGSLSKKEKQFAFNYGVFLQLVDDLQDIAEDKKEDRLTLFTRKTGYLDEEVRQLIAFIYAVNPPEENVFMLEVIRSCTLLMVMEAVSRHPDCISNRCRREIEAASPVRLSFYRSITAFFSDLLSDIPMNQPIQSLNDEDTASGRQHF